MNPWAKAHIFEQIKADNRISSKFLAFMSIEEYSEEISENAMNNLYLRSRSKLMLRMDTAAAIVGQGTAKSNDSFTQIKPVPFELATSSTESTR